jgi:hypothetical protein
MSRVHRQFILAVSASPRGFAFVVFSGPDQPFDWGVREIRGNQKNARCLLAIKKLLRRSRPEALVIEETRGASRRGPRIRALYGKITEVAAREQTRVVRYTKDQVRAAFAAEHAKTRPDIAQAVAKRIPAFAPKLPPLRKIWMSEDPRQSLFDAAAFGVVFYGQRTEH